MLNIGPQELILVLIVALVVVGPKRLPELGRTIGKAMREFRKVQDEVRDTIRLDMNVDPDPPVAPTRSPHPAPAPRADDGSAESRDAPAATVAPPAEPAPPGEPAPPADAAAADTGPRDTE